MARIRKDAVDDSSTQAVARQRRVLQQQQPETTSPPIRRRRPARYIISDDSDEEEPHTDITIKPAAATTLRKRRNQVKLAPLGAVQSCLGSISSKDAAEKEQSLERRRKERRTIIQREKPLARELQKRNPISVESKPCEDVEEEDVEESIWCGSASDIEEESEDELPSMKKFFGTPRKQQESAKKPLPLDISKQMKALAIFDDIGETRPTKISPTKKKATSDSARIFGDEDERMPVESFQPICPSQSNEPSRPGSSSDKENAAAIIRFSPPRNHNPIRSPTALDRSSIPPPQSPSKSRLKSPSKPRTRIPTPPHRPSLDAFWTAGTVNEWNDQYSPKKILKSPQKPLFQHSSSTRDSASPPPSPSKLRSPSKAETALRKEFVSRREDLAKSFLAELDEVITKGRVGELAASTGGVQVVWSKTLTSTAGRANWRRETTKTRDPKSAQPSQVLASTEKHYATIELATKVIDDEDRLLNVLAHEFCHLANFMVSGIKDQPHGKSFKEWGAKATKAFKGRGVEVTTKHSYAIDYKYIWACAGWDGCGAEFKRHSKSIDVERHRCGVCKGNLMQVKPVPRGAGKASTSEPGKKSEKPAATGYAAYVKLHFADVKKGLPAGSTHKDAMQALSRKYQAEKAAGGTSSPATEEDLAGVVKQLGAVRLGDSQSPIEVS